MTRAKRVASVRCVTYCNLYSLESSQFEKVLQSYPLMRRTMESVAAERLNKLGKNPSIISTRHDLRRDAAVLKDIISRATPQVSPSDSQSQGTEPEEEEEEDFTSNNRIQDKEEEEEEEEEERTRRTHTSSVSIFFGSFARRIEEIFGKQSNEKKRI